MRVGDVLDDRYELREKLGEGGFGVVWRAEDARMGRPVAVKVIGHFGGDQAKEALRFAREASAAGNLSHPHIVTVHDLGQGELAGREVTFLVMELLTGRTLTEVLRSGPPEPALSLRWVREICEALAAAHDAGVVHRDIKPDNVMVTDAGRLKVLDFGIAQLGTGAGGLTTTGTIVGSPAYMAPERWRGDPVDGRADLYAVGCLLVELLTGTRPFRADLPAAMFEHLTKPSPGLDPAAYGLAPQLALLVAELLAKEPQDRPADARTVARRLAELAEWRGDPSAPAPAPAPVAGQPVAGEPADTPPPADAPPPLPRSTPPMVEAPQPTGDPVRARLQELRTAAWRAADAAESASLLHALARECLAVLGEADRDTLCARRDHAWYLGRASTPESAVRLLLPLAEEMARALGGADQDALVARYHLARCVADSGETVTAIRLLTGLVEAADAAWGGQDDRVVRARRELAALQAGRGDFPRAVRQLRTLLRAFAGIPAASTPQLDPVRAELAHYERESVLAGRKREQRWSRRPKTSRGETFRLVRALRADSADFRVGEVELRVWRDALDEATGHRGVADRVERAPWYVTPEDLTEELFGP
ncbi:protein kinase [Kitasatospora sp. NPDC058162]|uniref:serine/threonine-protein kinase n=1 Tax=Kitasatospora sp. NPDC058162 TaxID=3346362 RepID=UPI0036DEACA4